MKLKIAKFSTNKYIELYGLYIFTYPQFSPPKHKNYIKCAKIIKLSVSLYQYIADSGYKQINYLEKLTAALEIY